MRSTLLGLCLLAALAGAPAARGEGEVGSAELGAARADLQAARFDRALAALDALLARTDLAPDTTAAALALRAEARVATGDLARAEQDWKRLLLLRPGYEPDPTTTGRKARERFDRVAATVVGTLKLEIDPPGARVVIDGKPVTPAADGTVRLPVGEKRVEVEFPGFDRADLGATVIGGDVVPLRVRLVPNARSVVLRTEPDGVEVRLDGTLLGRTVRPDDASASAASALARAARLEIPDLPLGEHVFDLTKPCYRTTRVRVQVHIGVADRGAILLDTVALDPARAVVAVRGRPEGGEVRADGAALGLLPVREATLCAGGRDIEVRAGGRIVWRERVELPEQGTATIEVAPRPQAVLFGAETWPAPLRELERRWGTEAGRPLPPEVDLRSAAGWEKLPLPPDTDLAAAVLPAEKGAAVGRVVVYSPILRRVEVLDAAPRSLDAPARSRTTAGWRLADLGGGGTVVAEVVAGGPASSAGVVPGARVARLGGTPVGAAHEVRAIVEGLAPGEALAVELEVPGEPEPRRASLRLAAASEFEPAAEGPAGRVIAAAWAAVDAAASTDRGVALLQLGALLLEAGRVEVAADVLSRAASASARPAGIVDYLRGRALAAAGREAEARSAFAAARDAKVRVGGDGPELSPAAADHLADLGVSPR